MRPSRFKQMRLGNNLGKKKTVNIVVDSKRHFDGTSHRLRILKLSLLYICYAACHQYDKLKFTNIYKKKKNNKYSATIIAYFLFFSLIFRQNFGKIFLNINIIRYKNTPLDSLEIAGYVTYGNSVQ